MSEMLLDWQTSFSGILFLILYSVSKLAYLIVRS